MKSPNKPNVVRSIDCVTKKKKAKKTRTLRKALIQYTHKYILFIQQLFHCVPATKSINISSKFHIYLFSDNRYLIVDENVTRKIPSIF